MNDRSELIKKRDETENDNWMKPRASKDLTDKIRIIYNVEEKEENLKIFGDNFVKNNINNCYLIIEGKQKELCSELMLNKEQKKNNSLEIKFIQIKPIINISNMFNGCNSLIFLPRISIGYQKKYIKFY